MGSVAAELAAHDGVITAGRAMACGLTRAQIRTRTESGEWRRVARGVFRSAAHPYTEAALVRGAAAAHGGLVDRSTAAWWHGLVDDLAMPLTLAVPAAAQPRGWSECRVQAVRRRYDAADVTRVRGLPVTRLPMTILTACLEVPDGARLLDGALQTQPVTLSDLTTCLDRNAGRRGFAVVRRLLSIAGGDTESAAERLFVGAVRAERLTGWELQYRFGRWRVDVAWPVEKVAVEIDGWAFHHGVGQFERDRTKRNALAAAGWVVLAFTWHQLTYELEACLRQLIAVLAGRRAELG